MAKKFDIQYYFSEGFHSIFTHGFMSFAAVCMIVACLLIMGSFTLVAVNLDNMLGDLEAENEFLAYVDESYTEEQARDIKSQIGQDHQCRHDPRHQGHQLFPSLGSHHKLLSRLYL